MKARFCKVEGCEKKHSGLGYCSGHYWRFKRYGNPLVVKQQNIHAPVRSDSLKRPNMTASQMINICAVFSGIRS